MTPRCRGACSSENREIFIRHRDRSREQQAYDFAGIDRAPVYGIANGQVAAVVSDVVHDRIRPERRHVSAAAGGPQGPAIPGPCHAPHGLRQIIADGPKAIQQILSRNHAAFLQQLQRVAGMVEMGLAGSSLDVPNIFEYVVNTHPELRAARDRFSGPTATRPRKTRSSWGACLTSS